MARFCIVEPDASPEPGDYIYLQLRTGMAVLGQFVERTGTGWPVIVTHGGRMRSEYNPRAIRNFFAVTWMGRTYPPADALGQSGIAPSSLRPIAEGVDALARQLRHLMH